jgi:hypothetical protein
MIRRCPSTASAAITAEERAQRRAQRRLDRQMMSPAQRARWLARRDAHFARMRAWYAHAEKHGARAC